MVQDDLSHPTRLYVEILISVRIRIKVSGWDWVPPVCKYLTGLSSYGSIFHRRDCPGFDGDDDDRFGGGGEGRGGGNLPASSIINIPQSFY